MDRKSFIRNIVGAIGAIGAVTIGKYLPTPVNDKPGIGGQQFTIKLGNNWMSRTEYELMKKHQENLEHQLWYGTPNSK